MATNKLSADLEGLSPSASVDVIIQFRQQPSAEDLHVVNRHGGVLKHTFQGIHGVVSTLKVGQLKHLASHPNITYISPDRKISGYAR